MDASTRYYDFEPSMHHWPEVLSLNWCQHFIILFRAPVGIFYTISAMLVFNSKTVFLSKSSDFPDDISAF
jgi:hypothetical protein